MTEFVTVQVQMAVESPNYDTMDMMTFKKVIEDRLEGRAEGHDWVIGAKASVVDDEEA